jgi:hypothetical protein
MLRAADVQYSTTGFQSSLLPDGRIVGQITQKRPQKLSMAGKNWRPQNSRIWQKVAEKRPENIFTII